MNRALVVLSHLGIWFCYFLLGIAILAILYGEEPNFEASQAEHTFQLYFLIVLQPSLITFYTCYFFIFPRLVKQSKMGKAVLAAFIVAGIAALISLLSLQAHYASDVDMEACSNDKGGIYWFTAFVWFVGFVAGDIALVIQGFFNWSKEVKLREALRVEHQEMELALIKAQLDPHFLFNTLNNIDILILKNAQLASNYLQKLSDIMRFILYETKPDSIPLSKEIAYMEKYVELQKIRTSNTHYVDFKVYGSSNGRSIPPMLFIPFIENAFKHTTNKKVQNAIQIQLDITPGFITFTCRNKYDPNRSIKTDCKGLGTSLIRKRLDLIYPKRHQLDIYDLNNQFCVDLKLKDG